MNKSKNAISYGEAVKPGPLEEDYITSIENAGARPEFVKILRDELKKHKAFKERQDLRRAKLKEITEYYSNLPEMPPIEIVRKGARFADFMFGLMVGFTLGIGLFLALLVLAS